MNQLQLRASVLEKEALRHTPAGIPVATAILSHRSEQSEAGYQRIAEMEITALVAGPQAARFAQIPAGTELMVQGFLCRKNRNSKSLVLHISEFEILRLD
ncbi:primosomal replication protein N [Undibacterium luofuense]|uniref:primosomal replication protein N n=1 Tax=Undibacterium luofuense TaxID=2828733 RepID=UPI003C6FB47B